MSLIVTIASRLCELRVRHGLTQEEAAELVGVSMRFYQLLESGRKKQMWLETVERLAASYGMEPWQFIGPELPVHTKPKTKVIGSSIHYQRLRKGPYRKPNLKDS
ncbi:putative transcriptional regulator [Opitutaceae bacterium TAV1]|nr:putative transcriptional regulator [Opitutaceae bacterium TAV1]